MKIPPPAVENNQTPGKNSHSWLWLIVAGGIGIAAYSTYGMHSRSTASAEPNTQSSETDRSGSDSRPPAQNAE